MPQTQVLFYQEDDGTVPVLDWLDGLGDKARAKSLVRIERLKELGHQLRTLRPIISVTEFMSCGLASKGFIIVSCISFMGTQSPCYHTDW